MIVVAGALTGTASAAPPATTRMAVGDVAPVPRSSVAAGPMAASTPLTLTVALKPSDPAGLADIAAEVSNPASPMFHHFLTHRELLARFGPSAATVAAVKAGLESLGVTPGNVTADGFDIPVHTTAGRAQSAFGVHLDRYRTATGDIDFANTAAPTLPGGLATAVQDVGGTVARPSAPRSPSPPPGRSPGAPGDRSRPRLWGRGAGPPGEADGQRASTEPRWTLFPADPGTPPDIGTSPPADLASVDLGGPFGPILADPPWRFTNRSGKVAPEHRRLHRYETMRTADIGRLPVGSHAAEQAHCYLWVPNALIADGLAVLDAWGFRYKAMLVWAKRRRDGGPDGRGVGFYFRNVTEPICSVCAATCARSLPPGGR
jgi:hypothetical protein